MIHFLGGSARSWDTVIPSLSDHFRCVGIDLPGFGAAAATPGYSVSEMADALMGSVEAERPDRWWLVGHSMGAKVATVVARRAENGDTSLAGLSRLVLIAGSPPGPEPMAELRRQAMMRWFLADPQTSRAEAVEFIDQSHGGTLAPDLKAAAVADVLRARQAAWRAWLDSGSREDWADRVGVLRTPALIIAGGSDDDLGPTAQAELMSRHLASARIVVLAGAGHLLPLERSQEIARLIVEFDEDPEQRELPKDSLDPDYSALIASDRVSGRTRAVLQARESPTPEQRGLRSLSAELLTVLRAMLDRVIPQTNGSDIDLAAGIDADLAAGRGDGWRFACLPADPDAYKAGLLTLEAGAFAAHGRPFAALDAGDRDALLERAASGDLTVDRDANSVPPLSALQMRLWFEDVRADAVKAYVAHPATLARIGYSGIANGGDGPRKQGFARLGEGNLESWEPRPRGLAS